MKCPACSHEPRDRLLSRPCPECGHEWWDTEDYVRWLVEDVYKLAPESALDIGCGNKGVIAQAFWERLPSFVRGFACDAHVIKPLPPIWTPLLCDAETLVEKGVKVDVVTHCGMLEHVDYEKALRILRVIEKVATKLVYFSCSTVLREVDYKVKRDGNPFHYYKSWWSPAVFEALGYTVDVNRMREGRTFRVELQGWFDPQTLGPARPRFLAARTELVTRQCSTPFCRCEPVGWWPNKAKGAEGGSITFCLKHLQDLRGDGAHEQGDVLRWIDHEELPNLPHPPWRPRRDVL